MTLIGAKGWSQLMLQSSLWTDEPLTGDVYETCSDWSWSFSKIKELFSVLNHKCCHIIKHNSFVPCAQWRLNAPKSRVSEMRNQFCLLEPNVEFLNVLLPTETNIYENNNLKKGTSFYMDIYIMKQIDVSSLSSPFLLFRRVRSCHLTLGLMSLITSKPNFCSGALWNQKGTLTYYFSLKYFFVPNCDWNLNESKGRCEVKYTNYWKTTSTNSSEMSLPRLTKTQRTPGQVFSETQVLAKG